MSVKKYLAKLEDLTGKEIIVTGGTSGIGLSIVKHLLARHASVVIMARNMEKAESVKADLLKECNESNIEFIKYDQSNDQSVLDAAKEIATNHASFYAIILNAGIMQSKKKLTMTDNYPTTIKTNFIGLSLLLETLLPLLKGEHRFIFQGSFVAGWRVKKFSSLKDERIKMWQRYIISKAGVEALFSHYVQLNSSNSFYLVEPGLVSTDIIRDFPTPIRQMGKVFLKVVSHSADKAALTALLAVQSTTPPGSYIVPRGFMTYMGYPKIKKFPNKRKRAYLVDMLHE